MMFEGTATEILNRNFPSSSYLSLDGTRTAYIIGNGQSRIGLDLNVLGGDIWGCNALFRDYEPDYLTILDVSIMSECIMTDYPIYHQCYFSGWSQGIVREMYELHLKPSLEQENEVKEFINDGHTHVTVHGGHGIISAIGTRPEYRIKSITGTDVNPDLFTNFFCGTSAAAMASKTNEYDNVVFVGFDSIWNYDRTKYNNIYAGSECYDDVDAPENERLKGDPMVNPNDNFKGNQTAQLKLLLDTFQNIDYYIMKDELSVSPLTYDVIND